jgi:uncharacterized Zn finger protein
VAERRTFGATWWGRAWLDALEGRAVHDPNRLPRGRTYARKGNATELAVGPGAVRALVHGSRPEPYEVLLEVRPFRDDEWECVLDAVVAKAGHAAALLDGELDPGVVADARAVDVELLPRSGELRTACSCPDWAEPCKHAAAVCYLMADALDDDPFVLLQLRGMGREEVLAAVRARRAAAAPTIEAGGDGTGVLQPGVPATDAWARVPGPLPSPPQPARSGAGRPAPWPSDPPREAPFDGLGLRRLAADAARRAWEVRTGSGTSGLELDTAADLARRALAATSTERRDLAARVGLTDAVLELQAAAWRLAGPAGLRVLDEPAWPAPATEMADARDRLAAAGVPQRSIRVRANRVTVGGEQQLRRSRDGRWYRFLKRSGRWTMASPGVEDVDELIDLPPEDAPW